MLCDMISHTMCFVRVHGTFQLFQNDVLYCLVQLHLVRKNTLLKKVYKLLQCVVRNLQIKLCFNCTRLKSFWYIVCYLTQKLNKVLGKSVGLGG